MFSTLLVSCTLALSSSATLWVEVRDLGAPASPGDLLAGAASGVVLAPTAEGPVEIPVEGDYTVWVWAPGGPEYRVELGTLAFDVVQPVDEKNPGQYVWLPAGQGHLAAGAQTLRFLSKRQAFAAAPAPIAGCVISTNAALKPAELAGNLRVQEEPAAVQDLRAGTARHTNTVFTMPEFESKAAWQKRAGEIRQRVLLSSGLWPLPERTPLNANIFDTIERAEYTVSKVRFEASPGFLVTGNLYQPKGDGPFPGVVCPHGHWETGRLENTELCSVPGRAITLAKLGIVTFTYDMIGYNDSLQFKHNWGGEQEKLWGIHPFAMQLWSSMRAVDFVSGLPKIDKSKIGCTGASGGGTQTFALCAVDPRIKVAAPVNMISDNMQGGCLCENAPILRMSNSNMEIGALMAPKPLLMVSATGDWTRETPRVEYPSIRSVYALYGAADHVTNVHVDEGHNYNKQSREAMYRFFMKWLAGKDGFENYTEPPFEVESKEALRVFADETAVSAWPDKDAILKSLIERNRQKTEARQQKLIAQGPGGQKKFEQSYRQALARVIGVEAPTGNDLRPQRLSRQELDNYAVERWILSRADVGDGVPAIFYRAKSGEAQDAVLLVHGAGKAAFADLETGGPGPLVQGLLAQGKAVLAIDPFLTGEAHSAFAKTERYREGNFMDTFQPTDTGNRVQDVLTAVAWLRSRRDLNDSVGVVGLEKAGMWALFAAAIDDSLGTVIVDLNQFAVQDDAAWVSEYYVPCLRAIGDVRSALGVLATDGGASAAEQVQVYNAPEGVASPIESKSLTISPAAPSTETILQGFAA